MAQAKIPPSERINVSYKQLVSISPELHSAAKELTKTIKELEVALQPLNLCVSAWQTIAEGGDEDGNYWSRSIGYTMVMREWCIALKDASGNEYHDDHNEQVWAFSTAPRWMVIESIAKLPELFETLSERVKDTTEKLKARTEQVKELVAAVTAAAQEIAAAKAEK